MGEDTQSITEPKNQKNDGLVTAGLVLGIVSIIMAFLPLANTVVYIMGLLAIIFGIIGLAKKVGGGKAVAALILGLVSIVVTVIIQIIFAAVLGKIIYAVIEEVTGGTPIDELVASIEDEDGNYTFMLNAGEKNSSEILDHDVSITIGSFSAGVDEWGFKKTSLPVTVTNLTNETKTFTITIEAVDTANNKRISKDYVTADRLSAGQTVDAEAFNYVDDDEVEALKNAEFRILDIDEYDD